MSCLNINRLYCPVNSRIRRAPVPLPGLPSETQVCRAAPRNDELAFVIDADHNSIWPTHRIRSFLISQQ